MHKNPNYRQAYIRLLRTHSEQITNKSAELHEQRKALKVLHKQEIHAAGSGLGMLKRIFLTMKHIKQMQHVNDVMEEKLTALRLMHQDQIHDLKISWQLAPVMNEVN